MQKALGKPHLKTVYGLAARQKHMPFIKRKKSVQCNKCKEVMETDLEMHGKECHCSGTYEKRSESMFVSKNSPYLKSLS